MLLLHTHTLYNSDFFSLSLSDLARANTPFLELFNSLNITERRSHSPSLLFVARFSLPFPRFSNFFFRAISESRIFPRPLPCQILVPRSIRLINVRNFWHQRIVRIRVAQQRTNRQQNLRNRQRRRPLLFQNVQTNAPVRVHVRMVHFCFEIYLWRFKRVIGREVDRDEEQAALVRTFGWADDGRVPVEYVVLRPRASRARGWRIFLQVLLYKSSHR